MANKQVPIFPQPASRRGAAVGGSVIEKQPKGTTNHSTAGKGAPPGRKGTGSGPVVEGPRD